MAEKEIRTILAPLRHAHVLLPNSAVAEVLEFSKPVPFANAPAWLLGELSWRGWQVPIISLAHLINQETYPETSAKARILIIKTLGESTQIYYIGLLINGLPKLKSVTAQSLTEEQVDNLPPALFSKVRIGADHALIPELGKLTRIVEQAAYGN